MNTKLWSTFQLCCVRMYFLKIRWNNEIELKKINYRNFDGIFRLILQVYGKNMKKYVSKFMQNTLRNSMTRNRFLQHVQKTCLDFCNMFINWEWFGIPHAPQRKFFPKCNFFFSRIHKKLQKNNIFLPKFAFSVPFNLMEMV